MELLYAIAAIAVLGLAFLGIERSPVSALRGIGPWLLVLAICAGILFRFPPTLEPYSWEAMQRHYFAHDMLGGLVFMLSFAVGAVLVSRALLRFSRAPLIFVPTFVGAMLVVWLVTLMLWSAALPGS